MNLPIYHQKSCTSKYIKVGPQKSNDYGIISKGNIISKRRNKREFENIEQATIFSQDKIRRKIKVEYKQHQSGVTIWSINES